VRVAQRVEESEERGRLKRGWPKRPFEIQFFTQHPHKIFACFFCEHSFSRQGLFVHFGNTPERSPVDERRKKDFLRE